MGNMENDQLKKILSALAQARGPAPLGYVSLHTGIKDPLTTLEKMEERGLVKRSPCSSWSSCSDPSFEIMPPVKEKQRALALTTN
jgi:hypothetical protein